MISRIAGHAARTGHMVVIALLLTVMIGAYKSRFRTGRYGGRASKAPHGGGSNGRDHGRWRASRRHPGLGRRAGRDHRAAERGHRGGELTLEEFSQRMERATAARTRAELGALVTDLPADAGAAGTAVAERSPAEPSWHISPVGGLRVYGPWRMDRHVIVISIVGGTRLDLSQVQLAAPEVTLTKVSLVGGVRIWVPTGIRVEVSGFSLIGGTRVEGGPQPGPGAPTVHIRAFSLVGGVRIRRGGPPQPSRTDRRPDRRSRRDRSMR
jgi:DUF1707 SHOCT-like domain/Cell wall-active antibiotics response LiaF, C-terminal